MLNKTIRVSEEVHELLSSLSTKNDSFNDIIKRLIEDNEELKESKMEFMRTTIK